MFRKGYFWDTKFFSGWNSVYRSIIMQSLIVDLSINRWRAVVKAVDISSCHVRVSQITAVLYCKTRSWVITAAEEYWRCRNFPAINSLVNYAFSSIKWRMTIQDWRGRTLSSHSLEITLPCTTFTKVRACVWIPHPLFPFSLRGSRRASKYKRRVISYPNLECNKTNANERRL